MNNPAFIGELVLKPVPPNSWELVETLSYRTLVKSKTGSIIKCPAGTMTDLASIPRLLRPLIPQNDIHREAAVIHDYLYRNAGLVRYTRKQADLVFLEAMKVSGVPRWKRSAMYRGVRVGGWLIYNKNLKTNTGED